MVHSLPLTCGQQWPSFLALSCTIQQSTGKRSGGTFSPAHEDITQALSWMDKLLWVLLGIRTAPKEDLATSSADLVYSAPLTVPGDFIPAARDQQESPSTMLTRLREKVGMLSPVPTSRHSITTRYVPPDLQDCHYIFLRRNLCCTKPYEGPFRALQHDLKAFIIDYGGRRETVSVDRLKPAHLDVDKPVLVAQPCRRGRLLS